MKVWRRVVANETPYPTLNPTLIIFLKQKDDCLFICIQKTQVNLNETKT